MEIICLKCVMEQTSQEQHVVIEILDTPEKTPAPAKKQRGKNKTSVDLTVILYKGGTERIETNIVGKKECIFTPNNQKSVKADILKWARDKLGEDDTIKIQYFRGQKNCGYNASYFDTLSFKNINRNRNFLLHLKKA